MTRRSKITISTVATILVALTVAVLATHPCTSPEPEPKPTEARP